MDVIEKELHYYQAQSGKIPFEEWFVGLNDERARDVVRARLARLSEENMKPSVPYLPRLLKALEDPTEALGYLQAALEDKDPRVFLVALRDVVRAQGGMTQLSRTAKINREHLYDLLSRRGNPEFLTLQTILSVLGYRLVITKAGDRKKAA